MKSDAAMIRLPAVKAIAMVVDETVAAAVKVGDHAKAKADAVDKVDDPAKADAVVKADDPAKADVAAKSDVADKVDDRVNEDSVRRQIQS